MDDELEFLRPEDIPPRRRSPKEPPDEEDWLTRELFGSSAEPRLTGEPDDLTRVIFADVEAPAAATAPRTINLASPPPGAPDPREQVLRVIEDLGEADFERTRKHLNLSVPIAKPAAQTAASRKRKLRPGLTKKIIVGAAVLAAAGAIGFFVQGRLAGPGGEKFLGGASFVISNQNANSPLREFLEKFLARDGDYLIVATDPTRNAPIGGEPVSWALLRIRGGRAGAVKEGTVAELSAAMTAKIVPPEPVRALKTSFDFFEAGWFFDIADFTQAFGDLFRETTGERVEGVVLISSGFVSRLGSAGGLTLDTAGSGWVQPFLNLVSAGASQDATLAALAGRELQFQFFDKELMSQAERLELANHFSVPAGADAFKVGLRSFEGETVRVELVEYLPQFFVDGSVVSTLSLRLAAPAAAAADVYVKSAVPRGSILLEAAGFSAPPPAPPFDYEANGFKTNPYAAAALALPADFFPQLDFFEEGGLAVIGGWVRLPAGATESVSISYRLPQRLKWQLGRDAYRLNIFKSGSAETTPFRFRASFAEGVGFEWRDPAGYLAGNLAEYQTFLRRDETLSATVIYQK